MRRIGRGDSDVIRGRCITRANILRKAPPAMTDDKLMTCRNVEVNKQPQLRLINTGDCGRIDWRYMSREEKKNVTNISYNPAVLELNM